MLRRLRIENLVLIRQADLSFLPGLNAMTGETGAGKTIAVQAFGLLSGARAEAKMIGPHGAEAYVEGEFDLPEGLLEDEAFSVLRDLRPEDETGLTLARRVLADGRSRAYAWGRGIAREDMVAIGERLLSLSGQFESRRLAKPSYQMDLLDAFSGDEQLVRRVECAKAWKRMTEARRRRDEILADRAGHDARLEELKLLVEATADFADGEEKTLSIERTRLLRVNDLAIAAQEAAEALAPELIDTAGAADMAGSAERALADLRTIDPLLDSVAADITSAEEGLRDAASQLRGYLSSLEAEPGRLEWIEGRLLRFQEAQRRFKVADYDALLLARDEAVSELDAAEAGEDPLARAEEALGASQAVYDGLTSAMREARSRASKGFSDAVHQELKQLGMGDGKLQVDLKEHAPGPRGIDEVAFLIKPNPGLPFAPIAQTASGGELSRIALALRVVSHAQSGEGTIVFDEIDAGVGGVTAHAVADSLKRLAGKAQLIAITHLPQIASVAQAHLAVTKVPGNPTQTEISLLDDDARKDEISRMLGGAEFLESVS